MTDFGRDVMISKAPQKQKSPGRLERPGLKITQVGPRSGHSTEAQIDRIDGVPLLPFGPDMKSLYHG
jgi:hypothetical protein